MGLGPLGCPTNTGLIDRDTTALKHNVPPVPTCALDLTRAQLEQAAAQAVRVLDQLNSSVDTRTVIGSILGQQSFTYGVIAGMVKALGTSIYELVELNSILALAEVYEMQHRPLTWERVLRTAVLTAAIPGAAATVGLTLVPGMDQKLKEAYETREGLFKAVKYAFEHPSEAFKKIAEDYGAKFQEFVEQEAKHTLVGNFKAGMLFGELLLEVLMVLDGFTTIFKIAQKGTRLLKLLTNLKELAPKLREAVAAGKGAARLESAAAKGAAEQAGKGAGKAEKAATEVDKKTPKKKKANKPEEEAESKPEEKAKNKNEQEADSKNEDEANNIEEEADKEEEADPKGDDDRGSKDEKDRDNKTDEWRNEEFEAPSTGKVIKAAANDEAVVPLDKVGKYARGKVPNPREELAELQKFKQSNRKAFDSDPENAARLKKLKNLQHNYDRSMDMAEKLDEIGLSDSEANNELIIEQLLEDGKSVAGTEGGEVESLLEGPDGMVKVRSTWTTLPDGRAYLSTLMLIPVK